jgi:hypothetical protein
MKRTHPITVLLSKETAMTVLLSNKCLTYIQFLTYQKSKEVFYNEILCQIILITKSLAGQYNLLTS